MILALQRGAISRSPRVADIARNGEGFNMTKIGVKDGLLLCVNSAGKVDRGRG